MSSEESAWVICADPSIDLKVVLSRPRSPACIVTGTYPDVVETNTEICFGEIRIRIDGYSAIRIDVGALVLDPDFVFGRAVH